MKIGRMYMFNNENNNGTMVITGGTGGIGLQSAIGIANTGAKVIITGRNKERGGKARQTIIDETNNKKIVLVVGDVSSISSIEALADSILDQTKHIDVLINNAGYLGDEFQKNKDGLEMHFAVNVLAPYRLTYALLPALQSTSNARVINVTGGDKPAAIDPDNLQAEKGFKGLKTYAHSKSVLESMSMALSRELEPEKITVNVVFPGRASTAMTKSLSSKSLPGLMKLMLPLFKQLFKEDGGKSASKAARSTIWAATSPELDGLTGRYFDTNSKIQNLHETANNVHIQAQITDLIKSVPK